MLAPTNPIPAMRNYFTTFCLISSRTALQKAHLHWCYVRYVRHRALKEPGRMLQASFPAGRQQPSRLPFSPGSTPQGQPLPVAGKQALEHRWYGETLCGPEWLPNRCRRPGAPPSDTAR